MSCSNELDLVAPHKDIPVVYGILCPSDTAQYIRLERAFIDQSIPATEIYEKRDNERQDKGFASLTKFAKIDYLLETLQQFVVVCDGHQGGVVVIDVVEKNLHDVSFVVRVEVAGGFVGQNDCGLIQ